MKALFGTDGIRGEAGQFPLDPTTVSAIGFSLASHLAKNGRSTGNRHRSRHARIWRIDRASAHLRRSQSRCKVSLRGCHHNSRCRLFNSRTASCRRRRNQCLTQSISGQRHQDLRADRAKRWTTQSSVSSSRTSSRTCDQTCSVSNLVAASISPDLERDTSTGISEFPRVQNRKGLNTRGPHDRYRLRKRSELACWLPLCSHDSAQK